jgi:hypothetical protein
MREDEELRCESLSWWIPLIQFFQTFEASRSASITSMPQSSKGCQSGSGVLIESTRDDDRTHQPDWNRRSQSRRA